MKTRSINKDCSNCHLAMFCMAGLMTKKTARRKVKVLKNHHILKCESCDKILLVSQGVYPDSSGFIKINIGKNCAVRKLSAECTKCAKSRRSKK